MKSLIVAMLFAGTCFAADEEKRRLESVTWNPVRHQFQWVVSKGKIEGDDYKLDSRERYEIDIDEATMSFSDETRRFSKGEAETVRRVLDFLARYAAESTIWWEKGQGEVIKKGERVSLPMSPRNPSPVAVRRPTASITSQTTSNGAARELTRCCAPISAAASATHVQERR